MSVLNKDGDRTSTVIKITEVSNGSLKTEKVSGATLTAAELIVFAVAENDVGKFNQAVNEIGVKKLPDL